MKPMIKTVNPKAGTLKQTSNAVRNNVKNVSRKLIAFVLMLSLALSNMAFVQGDSLENVNNENATAKNTTKFDTCCAVTKAGVTEITRRKVKLGMPSSKMIHKADKEAIENLLTSLKNEGVIYPVTVFEKADAEIVNNFSTEGKIQMPSANNISKADTEMTSRFNAAYAVSMPSVKTVNTADEKINILFAAENISVLKNDVAQKADQEISGNFSRVNNLKINMPSQVEIVKADDESHKNLMSESAANVVKTSLK
ncbi:MAG: hypothetical protein SFU87_04475 [Chitinophagaceae bacterium]|nr:hypothetical protein [Chitinophagaceae bacterium]